MQKNNNTDNNNYKTKINMDVDVTLNAFYGCSMLSPTTRSLKNSKTEVISGVVTHPKTRHHRQCQYHLVSAKPPAKHLTNTLNKL